MASGQLEKSTKPVTQFEIPSEVQHKPAEKVIKQVPTGIVTYNRTSSSVKATLVKKVFEEQQTKLEQFRKMRQHRVETKILTEEESEGDQENNAVNTNQNHQKSRVQGKYSQL